MDCTGLVRSYMALEMLENAATPTDRNRLLALFIFLVTVYSCRIVPDCHCNVQLFSREVMYELVAFFNL